MSRDLQQPDQTSKQLQAAFAAAFAYRKQKGQLIVLDFDTMRTEADDF